MGDAPIVLDRLRRAALAPMVLGLQIPVGELGSGEACRAKGVVEAPGSEEGDAVGLVQDRLGQDFAGHGGGVEAVATEGGDVQTSGCSWPICGMRWRA